MDVTFELKNQQTFCIEVGFFDSFQEIKEKINKYKGIPVSTQTLLFDGQLLSNDTVIFDTDICVNSRIQLVVASELTPSLPPPSPPLPSPPPSPPPPSPPPSPPPPSPPPMRVPQRMPLRQAMPLRRQRVEFTVKIVDSRARPFSIEMNLDDTILQLKDKISMMKTRQKLKLQEMSVRLKSGEELHDHCSLRDCGMLNISHVYVHKTLPQQPRLSSAAFGPKMLKLMVVLKGGTHKIPIEVNSLNRVEELKFELEKFHKHLLPENGRYFFTYQKKGYVMSDTHAFSWYMIEDGDTIQITPQQE